MSKVLHISSSISGDASTSRQLGTQLADRLAQANNAQVIERDVSDNTIPLLDAARFQANTTAADNRTAEQQDLALAADTLIEELQSSDTIVMSVPMYNFGVPAQVKAWADLVARAGTTFRYTPDGPEGLLTNKRAYIVATSGGTPFGGEMDYTTTWLAFFLGFLGIEVAETFTAPAIFGENRDEVIAATRDAIAQYEV